MIEGIEALRDGLGTFERAWMRAQVDEDLENPDHAMLYAEADILAADRVQYVDVMLGTLVPYLELLDLDPNDGTGLHYAAAQGETDPALRVALALREVRATFKHWAAEGGFSDVLNAAELRVREWIEGQPELPDMAAALAETKARAARAEMAQRGQQRGNTVRVGRAKARARAAWATFGQNGPGGPSLLARLKRATDAQQAALADLYGYADDVGAFLADATDKNSSVRAQLKRDNQK